MSLECCVPGCPGDKIFHAIPSTSLQKKQWLLNINQSNQLSNINSVDHKLISDMGVCNLHFRCQDYLYVIDEELVDSKELLASAVPSIFPWSENWDEILAQQNSRNLLPETASSPSTYDNYELFEGIAVEIGNVGSLGIVLEEDIVTEPVDLVYPNAIVSCITTAMSCSYYRYNFKPLKNIFY